MNSANGDAGMSTKSASQPLLSAAWPRLQPLGSESAISTSFGLAPCLRPAMRRRNKNARVYKRQKALLRRRVGRQTVLRLHTCTWRTTVVPSRTRQHTDGVIEEGRRTSSSWTIGPLRCLNAPGIRRIPRARLHQYRSAHVQHDWTVQEHKG